MFSLLLRGFLLGFAVAASPGPIFFLCVRRTLTQGRLTGLFSGFGVATADGFYAATATFPSVVEDVSGALGRGGYEGIQNDSRGNLWIAEDIGGPNKQGTTARQPNSYVYRYVPKQPGDLHNGKLQVLQVMNAGPS